MLCPKDLTGCPDDLCRGSGCMKTDGAEMIPTCAQCYGPVVDDRGEPDDSRMICDQCEYRDYAFHAQEVANS